MSAIPPPPSAGYICAAVACLCFGSNFVPVKSYSKQIGDGIFFQWILCSAIWTAGFIVYSTRGFPPFHALAMLGGFLWCTGNIMTVPIIKCIGLSLGMLFWGLSNLLIGWCSATFGLFGLEVETVSIPWLNYLGAVLACISGIIFGFIKPTETEDIRTVENKLVNDMDDTDGGEQHSYPEGDWLDRWSPLRKRVVGVLMAVLAGCFYGTNFNPPQYIMDHCGDTCSKNGMDYVFPHFCGIYLTSTFYFLLYCVLKQNKPIVPREVAYPGFLSGLMWALAQICWFVANSSLQIVVAFPIVTIVPGAIASLWGILVFSEIQGIRNFLIFGSGFTLVIISVICTVLSKIL